MIDLSHETLCIIWFLLLGVLLTGYAVLDGFDLGVGILHPFAAKEDKERRVSMNSIGPLWDGNEVWLVTFGGAMFAMFPIAYASVFSGFYSAFVLLLFSLIFRAVSLEFRSKVHSPAWRNIWDWCFCGSSLTASLLFGIAVGNIMLGIPLDEAGNFLSSLPDQLKPYPLLTGALAASAFALHGALFLHLKTTHELQQRLYRIIWTCFGLFLVLYLFTTIATLAFVPRALLNFHTFPWLWVVPVLHVLAVANIPRCIFIGAPGWAFLSSMANIASLVALFGISLFPYIVPSVSSAAAGLSIFDAASSKNTLTLGLYIVGAGMPLILSYTAVIYWTFRGKTVLDAHSY